jgi:hypothetical protein
MGCTTESKFWLAWLKESLKLEAQYTDTQPFYYAWLRNTMTEEELAALTIAADKLNLAVVIKKDTSGLVTRKT